MKTPYDECGNCGHMRGHHYEDEPTECESCDCSEFIEPKEKEENAITTAILG